MASDAGSIAKDSSVLFVGPGGVFGREALHSTAADVDALVARLTSGSKTRLVVFFHGGLVSRANGAPRAEELSSHYGESVGALIGMVWGTGVLETLQANLGKLHRLKGFRKLLAWALEKVLERKAAADGAKGLATAELTHQQIEVLLETPGGVEALQAAFNTGPDEGGARGGYDEADDPGAEARLAIALQVEMTRDPTLLPTIEAEPELMARLGIEEDGQKGLDLATLALLVARVVYAVLRRRRRGTDHGWYGTTVEEILRAAFLADVGQWIWNGMKHAAEAMWTDDGATPGEAGHVGGYLLRKLAEAQARRPDLKVDLVGHSAGVIALCHMLKAIRARALPVAIDTVVFLAAACRMDLFAEAVARNPAIRRFRAFALDDAHERDDALVGGLYPHSLLYFVSGALEPEADAALAGLQRHLRAAGPTAGAEYDDVRRWLGESSRLVYGPTAAHAPAGVRCTAKWHGGFDADPGVVVSLIELTRA